MRTEWNVKRIVVRFIGVRFIFFWPFIWFIFYSNIEFSFVDSLISISMIIYHDWVREILLICSPSVCFMGRSLHPLFLLIQFGWIFNLKFCEFRGIFYSSSFQSIYKLKQHPQQQKSFFFFCAEVKSPCILRDVCLPASEWWYSNFTTNPFVLSI